MCSGMAANDSAVAAFEPMLPLAAHSGTLANRFIGRSPLVVGWLVAPKHSPPGTIGAGRIHAKTGAPIRVCNCSRLVKHVRTGTLTGVNAISGYINRSDLAPLPTDPLVFSVVVTG